MKSSNEIRKLFLDYFAKYGHKALPSSSLIPHNDPSLMFTNSGMVQFKDLFLGREDRGYTKAVTSQKCVRAGGKHNDLDNVGYTKRHLTFFEMLGNFSFGDYFKEESIEYAWNFLTQELGLDKSKLYITIYHTDEEAYSIWEKTTGFSDDKIIRISTNDNFWSMGDVGPCGPCSEIFYDQGEDLFGGLPGTKDQDGDRFVEIWNLVFMQNEQSKSGEMIDLPKKSVDTGMGLERIASIMQGVYDNFKTDTLKSIIDDISDVTSIDSKNYNSVSHRIIADHLRSSAFLIADGVMPVNEGRGYVLRRIMRRAIRHIHNLGYKDVLLPKLLPNLVSQMGVQFSELTKSQALISDVFTNEEKSFRSTLDRGMRLIEDKMKEVKPGSVFSGQTAFELHDTYGFPIDLTETILQEKGVSLDRKGFDESMDIQKKKARAAWSGSGDGEVQKIWFDIKEEHGRTEFLGYNDNASQAIVTALVQDDEIVDKIDNKREFYLLVNQTPFYAESGGQVGDIGVVSGDSFEIEVVNTKTPLSGLHAHLCKLSKGNISVGENVNLEINRKYRNKLRRNHTTTHLLHAVLKNAVGEHVAQRGSLVAEDRLRFDFSHTSSITRAKLDEMQNSINHMIVSDASVSTRLMKYDDAVSAGAMALFGEKYGDEVRVVFIEGIDHSYSVELCGGTHVSRLGEIGAVKIISESSISSGVRRIEAVTGPEAYESWAQESSVLSEVSSKLQSNTSDISEKIDGILSKNKKLEKEVQKYKQKDLASSMDTKNAVDINGIKFLSQKIDDIEAGDLRMLLQKYISNNQSIGLFFGRSGEKTSFICGVSKDLHDKVGAKDLIALVAGNFGSNGGGNMMIAQGGGKSSEDSETKSTDDVIAKLKSL
jgi:alanyl-tRNA synthetase